MCGFAGELRLDGATADVGAVVRMAATMKHRGPDGSGVWASGAVALGHQRLSVIDLSTLSAQPMVDRELGLAIVFNGCIYNYPELRHQLVAEGERFISGGDTEVILRAYRRWGLDFVDRLQGMFAFCIVETDTGRAVLVRDRLGIKPLYLNESGSTLRFASTLPALVAGGEVDTSIDTVALHHYLSFHSVVPPPRTILNGVRKLPPATVLVVEPDGTRRSRRYWSARHERHPDHAAMTQRDWQDAVLAVLRTAVTRRLVADVPVGVLLSGGLDSSLIVGLLDEAGATGLTTFSVGFQSAGGLQGDEFRYSDIVARTFATDHHQLRIDGERLLPALEGAVGAMSEPMASHDAVAFYLLSQEVSRHVTVVQSGQGADEVFAGYHWYPPLAGVDAHDAGGAVDAYATAFFDRPHSEVSALLAPEWRLDDDASRVLVTEHLGAPGAATAVDRALRLDSEVMLVDDPVKRVDNMTMAWGLEARVPFLDHEVVELAAACPPELKLASGGKGVLKEAARQVIPHEVIDRPKGYFPVPALTHLQGRTLDLVEEALRDPAAKERGLFRPEAVEALLDAPNERLTPLGGNTLWQLGLLELWLQGHGVS
ncbi:MAG: N-acetylglutaminylglutamine amidotransferase [Actinomycetota bacterium]|nr:N-acetylglutaminylglutamine amidotransferase [Actinomycetota bacterium]MDP9020645.1 N-acetylglutaminylglutamine amidotransferase [Actinomycetota bacterium]